MNNEHERQAGETEAQYRGRVEAAHKAGKRIEWKEPHDDWSPIAHKIYFDGWDQGVDYRIAPGQQEPPKQEPAKAREWWFCPPTEMKASGDAALVRVREVLPGDDVEALRDEVETLRMQVVACGVVAMANTPYSAEEARKTLPKYRSVALCDVERAVDKQIELQAELNRAIDERNEAVFAADKELAKLRADVEALRADNLLVRLENSKFMDRIDELAGRAQQAESEAETLRAEVEKLRVQLAGCGVIAMSNTRESLRQQTKDISPKYMCASIDDCIKAAEREIALRAERDVLLVRLNESVRKSEWDDVIESREKALIECEEFKAERDEYRNDLLESERWRDKLREDLDKVTAQRDEQRKWRMGAEDDRDQIRKALADTSGLLADAQCQLGRVHEMHGKAVLDLISAQSRIIALQDELAVVRNECATLSAKLTETAKEPDLFEGAPDWAEWRWTEKGGHEVWTQNRPVYGIDGMVCDGLWAYVPNDDARKVTKRVRK